MASWAHRAPERTNRRTSGKSVAPQEWTSPPSWGLAIGTTTNAADDHAVDFLGFHQKHHGLHSVFRCGGPYLLIKSPHLLANVKDHTERVGFGERQVLPECVVRWHQPPTCPAPRPGSSSGLPAGWVGSACAKIFTSRSTARAFVDGNTNHPNEEPRTFWFGSAAPRRWGVRSA